MIPTLRLVARKKLKLLVVVEDEDVEGAVEEVEVEEEVNLLQGQVQKRHQEDDNLKGMKILMKIIVKKKLCQEREAGLQQEKRLVYHLQQF